MGHGIYFHNTSCMFDLQLLKERNKPGLADCFDDQIRFKDEFGSFNRNRASSASTLILLKLHVYAFKANHLAVRIPYNAFRCSQPIKLNPVLLSKIIFK